jgi:glyoxylase-like metal-dependent hydrolase (beta-lactamase superfamily II)/rhodanese-related sulfurtransferase
VYFAQHYLDCLSHASYLIGDETTGLAVAVDPRRDIAEYLADADQHGLTIVGVINTHFHADFLAGHLEVAAATGAWIGYGAAATTEYASRAFADGERIVLGDVVLEIMATPGHTPESISVLVYEHMDDPAPYGVLTGDALFIGDVGRPDLLASIGFTADQLGRQLYDSIQHKLMTLPDEVRVFPAHGAGSACGKNLSTELQSTIGQQRLFNYACQPMGVEEFIAIVTAGQPAAPEYFVYDAILNRKNRDVLVAGRQARPMDAAAVAAARAAGVTVIDTRDDQEFAAGHLRRSINIPADGRFAETAGMVLQPADMVIVIAAPGGEQEVATRLARIGFDQTIGYIPDVEGALIALQDDVSRASRLTPAQLADLIAGSDAPWVLDVRNVAERERGSVPGAAHIPLAELGRRLAEVPSDRPIVAYCAGGWRSSVAASFLRRHRYSDVSDLAGGFSAWEATRAAVPVS